MSNGKDIIKPTYIFNYKSLYITKLFIKYRYINDV